MYVFRKRTHQESFNKMLFYWKMRFKAKSFAWKLIYLGEAFVRKGFGVPRQSFWLG